MIRRVLLLMACLGCDTGCPEREQVELLEQRLTAMLQKHDEQELVIEALSSEIDRLDAELADARLLALIGGPRRRWRGAGVTCDGSLYLPGSFGAAAHRALAATGYCEPATLPAPPTGDR